MTEAYIENDNICMYICINVCNERNVCMWRLWWERINVAMRRQWEKPVYNMKMICVFMYIMKMSLYMYRNLRSINEEEVIIVFQYHH